MSESNDGSIHRLGICIFAFVLLIPLAAVFLFGQGGVTSAISGRVTDPSGAPVPGAIVIVESIDTGASFRVYTTSDGLYIVKYLTSGTYEVTVTKQGFQKEIVTNILVQAGSHPTANAQLKVGSVSQAVTVRATTSMLQMQSADVGTVVDTVRVNDSPTQQGNIMGLAYATAGVQRTSDETSFTPFDNSQTSATSINGSQPGNQIGGAGTSDYEIDGVEDRVQFYGGYGALPTQADTQELSVVTNPFSAEYGQTLGGVVSVETKSGTNRWHGLAAEYNRNTAFAANTFTRNAANEPIQELNWNTDIGQLGGPVKKNKLWFFMGYWHIKALDPVSYYGMVPTQAQRNGDYSQTYYNNNGVAAVQTIYNPFSVTYNATTGLYTRTAFPNNMIPSSMMSPIAANVLKYIPLPTGPGAPITGADNYYPTSDHSLVWDSMFMPRVDWQINDANHIDFRFFLESMGDDDAYFYPDEAVEPQDTSFPFGRKNQNAVMNYTRILSPTSILNVNMGMERYIDSGYDSARTQITPAELGFSSTFVSQAFPAFPVFGFGQGSDLGATAFSGAGTGGGSWPPDQVNTLNGTWTKSLGRHTLKVGAGGLLERYYDIAPGNNAGDFGFSLTMTNLDPLVSTASSGNPLAAFQLGVGDASIDHEAYPALQDRKADWFVQDDIKVSPKLTINAGLRWDWAGGITDRFNALDGPFETNVANPLATEVQTAPGVSNCPACANLAGGLTFPGVNGVSRSPYSVGNHAFQPRLGVAYALNSKTAIRAGWGLFDDAFVFNPGNAGFSETTSSLAFYPDYMPENLIADPFPTGLIKPTGASLGLLTDVGAGISFVDPNQLMVRSQQFNFNVQRLLSPNTILTVGYSYNGIAHVPVSKNLDALTAAQDAEGASVLDQIVTNPFAGLAPGYALNDPTVALSQLIIPYPQFSSVTENDIPIGTSDYQAFEIELNRHFSEGISASVAYTNSLHEGRYWYTNQTDTQLAKTIDPFNIPQVLQINEAWQLPIGRGFHFLSNMPKWEDYIIGGWELTSNIQVESGTPWEVSGNTVQTGVNPIPAHQTLEQWVNPAAFTLVTNPFALLPPQTYLRNVHTPYFHNVDAGLMKNFKLTERVTLTIETDWINAFNTPQWWGGQSGGCETLSNSCFGAVIPYYGQTNYARQIQMNGRITF